MGGDLVDVVAHDGGWLGYVADVSGHGVASGVVMGMFKSALRARLLSGVGLAALLAELNAVLIPSSQRRRSSRWLPFVGAAPRSSAPSPAIILSCACVGPPWRS